MLLVILNARPGKEKELESALRALVAPTRREEGCLRYSLYRAAEPGAAGRYLLYEVWRSREAHARHTQTPHFQRWSAHRDEVLESRDSAFWTQIA